MRKSLVAGVFGGFIFVLAAGAVMLPAQQEVIDATRGDIRGHVRSMAAKWIVEGGIEQDWDQFQADLKKMGLEKMMATYQEAYDSYISQ